MSNPVIAEYSFKCDVCGDWCEAGEELFYHEDSKHCLGCAEVAEVVCSCGQYKKPEYDQCYECWGGR